jgi:hypothetical protein
MSMFNFEKKQETAETVETIVEEDLEFWNKLEKIAIVVENKEEIACWNCCLFFTTKCWGIPTFTFTEVIPGSKSTEYELFHNLLDGVSKREVSNVSCFGKFCSIVCANRFLTETAEIPQTVKSMYRNLLYFAYSQYVQKKISYIPMSIPPHEMKIFCGSKGLSEHEYREKNKNIEREIF